MDASLTLPHAADCRLRRLLYTPRGTRRFVFRPSYSALDAIANYLARIFSISGCQHYLAAAEAVRSPSAFPIVPLTT